MAIILPHGVLFRSGSEEKIRRKLLEDSNIDTVIGPPGQYIQTITIKMEKDPKVVHNIKQLILDERNELKLLPNSKSVRVNIVWIHINFAT